MKASWLLQNQDCQAKQIHRRIHIETLYRQLGHLYLLSFCRPNSQQIGFETVQEGISSSKSRTLPPGLVAPVSGQCTDPQLHPGRKFHIRDGLQNLRSSPLYSRLGSRWRLVVPKGTVFSIILRRWRRCGKGLRYCARLPQDLHEVIVILHKVNRNQRTLLRKILELYT